MNGSLGDSGQSRDPFTTVREAEIDDRRRLPDPVEDVVWPWTARIGR